MRAVPGASRVVACLIALAGASIPALAAAPEGESSVSAVAARALERDVRVHRLGTGMTFLLLPRRGAPVFSGVIQFKVGGLDEDRGQSGLAHLFEHLAFQGTTRIGGREAERERWLLDEIEELLRQLSAEESRSAPDGEKVGGLREKLAALKEEQRRLMVPNEFQQIYISNGAVGLNASTDKDFTRYYVSLPANRLELWFLMESERLRDGVLRDFYGERDVVMEERRLRVDTQPFGKLYEALLGAAFEGGPYAVPTIGYAEDLRKLLTADAVEFRRRHYRPENAVGALVGDFAVDEALRLIERYFGDWRVGAGGGAAAGAVPAAATPPVPGGQAGPAGPAPPAGPRRVEVSFPSEPYLLIGFPKPVHPHPDAATFEVMEELLTGGRSARLYHSLVTERRMSLDIDAFQAPGQRLDNLFVIAAVPQAPHTSPQVESAILEELARLSSAPIAESELERVRSQFQADFIRALSSNLGMALQLAHYQSLFGDWSQLLRLLERVARVGAADVRAVAGRYLQASRRVTAELVPDRPQAEGAAR
jgi:predicted Zn-dependent peptidase